MIFVSKGYFKSKNCIREVRCTIAKSKPITLVHDPVRGGGSLEFIKNEECDIELHGIFEGRDVIMWHRIKVRAPCLTCCAYEAGRGGFGRWFRKDKRASGGWGGGGNGRTGRGG
jgi:hypothetical protein